MEHQCPRVSQMRPEGEVEVSLVFRHFHPILAGAAERFRRYSRPLMEHGIRYEVFTLREDERHPAVEQMHDGLRVHRIAAKGQPWARDARLFQAAWLHLSELPGPGHVLQTSLAHDLSAPWLRRTRKRGVGCVYVGTMVGRRDESIPAWRRWAQKWKSWRNFKPFDRVVASTSVMARWFESCGVAKEKIEIIPNGVDVDRFHPIKSPEEKWHLRETHGLHADVPVVIFAGSIVPRKGVELLLRAWPRVLAQVPQAQLVLVGGFDRPTFMTQERMRELSNFQDSMRALASMPECRGSVTFAGESSRLEDWMRAADIFVFPTEQEGMGNVVLEAMACGLPAVITEFYGMPEKEFGVPGQEFQLVSRNEEALAEGLRQILSDSNLASKVGRAARSWACTQLDVRLTIESYARLYRELGRVV